jgi:caspase domain-containing protein
MFAKNNNGSAPFGITQKVGILKPSAKPSKVLEHAPKRYALLIGINYTDAEYELQGCVASALAMKDYLVQNCRFSEKDIVFMSDVTNGGTITPTRRNILNQLANMVASLQYGDLMYVHYIGHGTYEDTEYCMISVDCEEISDKDLKHIVNEVPVGCKFRCVLDNCFSGTVTLSQLSTPLERRSTFTTCLLSDDILFLNCIRDEDEAYMDSEAESVVTNAILAILKSNPGHITWENLMHRLYVYMKHKGFSQVPQLSLGNGALELHVVDL